ncbi:hypothetical protein JTE90_011884 [Oedothorax gibbosus]|uniref:Tryptophan--tRNA ligase, mitochondrial n=1 Tax=Oedothorax gibbosus TaxID=931172 RepID=A0AAV6V6B5_9ARAC|nr:hypothetical protein JTE90_011884 [Oedothorax gibbosus]
MANFILKVNKYFKPFSTLNLFRQVHTKHKQTIFSGIQPTGVPHLGNYFGAIKQWSSLQNEGKHCVFSIVDLHSITLPQDPQVLRNNIHVMAACLMACGINPEKSLFFLQSQVPQHTELQWILACYTTMARLAHLPQYKEKSSDSFENVPLGLFIYPVLQSADILLYKATDVPIGEDQLQHIQLSQHLVKVFNNKYGNIFPVPQPLIGDNSARIKSLKQPNKKMSKSDLDSKNRIDITDSPDIIAKRIKQAITDFTSEVTYDPENRPGVSNLVRIHGLCTGQSHEKICENSISLNTGQYKKVVADAVIEHLNPIRTEFERLMKDCGYIEKVLLSGSERAAEMALRTMVEVKSAVGLSIRGKVVK